ncbi:DUF2905 domain-containing protein [Phorcysia thermohydrogeniphila]|uniref:DUF2905 family protein n=1 Tax=Phorcysia thermohydrogeniphila TaxID=936138 RepID=A0A4R1GEZ4_9BACT|nr:DUF2905 domain-containing protein [Phorcysia thermohydrogeniphila]TCK05430.1 Protein of unknown function (DUF2905) [Phorcysia thermohydrogeniphila]
MEEVGKVLIYTGVFLVITGVVIMAVSKWNIPIGKLPGDIYIKKDNFAFYFPLGTSLLISLAFSLFSFLLFLLMRKQ